MASCPNFPDGKVYEGYKNHIRNVEMMDGIRVVRCKTYITSNKGTFRRILDYLSYTISTFVFAFWEKKPDVVISTSPHLFVPMAGCLYAKIKKIPHVFEIRDLWPASILGTTSLKQGRIYSLLESLELLLYKNSTKIICFTNAFRKNLISRNVETKKIGVVINGANLDLFQPKSKNRELEKKYNLESVTVVGYMGTIGLASGLQNLIKTAELLKNEPVKFLLVGSGALLEELKQNAQQMQLNNIVFAGRQLKESMPDFWSVCDLSLIHLKNDPVFKTVIPSKIFESMAMGLPILYVGPDGEGPEIVYRHTAGVYVEPGNPEALANEIKRLINSSDLKGELKQNSMKAAALYSRERQAEGTLDALNEALKRYQ